MPPFINKTVLLALSGTVLATAMPLCQESVAAEGDRFSDVELNYWARPFIEKLAARDIIAGFPDGTFKPTQPVTRAQFAAILRQAFEQSRTREYRSFVDVKSDFWGVPAIREAYETGFMSGYTDGSFKPDQKIPRVQAMVSLASGLRLKPSAQSVDASLGSYQDAAQIPEYARSGVAAATQSQIVVNYPNLKYLNPNEVTTRADVAAFVYQALVDQGELEPLAKSLKANGYVVKAASDANAAVNTPATPASNSPAQARVRVAAGTKLPVKAPGSQSMQYAIIPSEIYATNLVVSEDILGSNGKVLIPKGSLIQGAFKPFKVQTGSRTEVATRYIAESIRINDRVYSMRAISSPRLATASTEVKAEDVDSNIRTSNAAQAILRTVLPSLGETLLGQEPKVESSATDETSVILINPETDLNLTVRSIFEIDA